MLDYFWAVLIGYTLAMFVLPLLAFFYIRGSVLHSIDYYYYSVGQDWESATYKAVFGAVAIVQFIIAAFIVQHFRDDCKEVFSGRSFAKHQARIKAKQRMDKQQA